MTQLGDEPLADYTFGRLWEDTLLAFHEGSPEDLEIPKAILDDLMRVSNNVHPGLASYAYGLRRELWSAEAMRDGTHAARRKAMEQAAADYYRIRDQAVQAQPLTDFPSLQAAQAGFKVATVAREETRAAFERVDYGDGLVSDGIFSGPTPRTRIVTDDPWIGGVASDAYLFKEKWANQPLDKLLRNDDGSPRLDPTYRREVLDFTQPMYAGEEGREFLETSTAGRVYIDRELSRFRREDVKEEIRRAMLGFQRGGGLEPAAIQEWAIKQGVALFGAEGGGKGFTYDVTTADVSLTLPYLPNLYPEEGRAGLYRSHAALQEPEPLRAFVQVVGEMQRDGELRPTMGEQSSRMLSNLAEFFAVNGGIAWGAKAVAAGSGAVGLTDVLAKSERLTALGRGASRLKANLGMNKVSETMMRPVGMVFDKRNIVEEVAYAVTRNALTGEGTAWSGAAEGAAEGVAEGVVFGMWRGFLIPTRWLGGKVSGGIGKPLEKALGNPAWLETVLHPVKRAHQIKSNPVALLQDRLSSSKRLRNNVRRGLIGLHQQGVLIDGAAQAIDAGVVGTLFGAYEAARADSGREWRAMSIKEKALAIANSLSSPEALGNMVAYSGMGGAMAGANLYRNRLNVLAKHNPEVIEALEAQAAGIVDRHLDAQNFETFEEFVQVFEEAKKTNPDAFARHPESNFRPRSKEELTQGEQFTAAAEELEAHGLKKSKHRPEQAFEAGWKATRALGKDRVLIDVDEQALGRHRLWTREGQEYAVKLLQIGQYWGYAVVHASDPTRTVEHTAIWETMEGAASQADGIIRDRSAREAKEVGDEGGLPLDSGIPAPAWLDQVPELRDRWLRGDATAEEVLDETLKGLEGGAATRLRAADELEGFRQQVSRAARRARAPKPVPRGTPPDAAHAQATHEAHATDPEHAGKPPAQVVQDVTKEHETLPGPVQGYKPPKKLGKRKKGRPKPRPKTAREVIAGAGGLRWSSDTASLDDGKRRAGMHGVWFLKKGSKARGMTVAEAGQVLMDAGFAPDTGLQEQEGALGLSADEVYRLLSENALVPERAADVAQAEEDARLAEEQAQLEDQLAAHGFETIEQAEAWAAANRPPDPVIPAAQRSEAEPRVVIGGQVVAGPEVRDPNGVVDTLNAVEQGAVRLILEAGSLEGAKKLAHDQIAATTGIEGSLARAALGWLENNADRVRVEYDPELIPAEPIPGLGAVSKTDALQAEGLAMGPEVRLAQAGTAQEQLFQLLQSVGLLPADTDLSPTDPLIAQLTYQAAVGGVDQVRRDIQELGVFESTLDVDEAAKKIHERARQVVSFQQQAAFAMAKGDPELARGLELYFRAKEAEAFGGRIEGDDAKEMAGLGMLDEYGLVTAKVGRDLQRWFDAGLAKAYGDSAGHLRNAFYSLGGWDLFGALGLTPYEMGSEFIASRIFRSNRWTQRIGKTNWKPLNKIFQAMNAIQRGPFGRFASAISLDTRVKELNTRFLSTHSRRLAQRSEWIYMTENALQGVNLPFGPEGAPDATWRALYDLIDSGAITKMKGPEDVARQYGKEHEHLFDVAMRLTQIFDAIGQEAVNLGWMRQGQFDRWQGRYVMHAYLRKNKQTLYELSKAGDFEGVLAGRNLSRSKSGEHDQAIRIMHPQMFEGGAMQESKAVQFLGLLTDLVDQGMVLPQEMVASLSTPRERGQYEVAALDGPRGEVLEDPVNKRKAAKRQIRLYEVLEDLRQGMQTAKESEANITSARGRNSLRPYSPELQKVLDAFLGVRAQDGTWEQQPMATTTGIAQQLDAIVSHTFYPANPSSAWQRAAQRWDEMVSHWRIVQTIQNPVHWVMARVSDIVNNFETGIVGVGDFISSMILGRGSYYDAMAHSNWLHEYTQLGFPEGKPEGWTDEKWRAVQEAREVSNLLFGSTYTQQLLKSGALGDYFSRTQDPDHFRRFVADDVRRSGLSGEIQTDLLAALTKLTAEMHPGKLQRDAKRLERWGEREPTKRAQAVLDWIAEYQAWEFWGKYAGYLNLKKHNPGLPMEDLVNRAAKGTADYRDTSPYLQQWSTNFNLFDQSKGALASGAIARFLLANPFMLYEQNRMPTKLRNLVARTPQVAMAVAMYEGLKAVITSGMTDEEREEEFRASAGSLDQPARPYISVDEAKQLAETLAHIPWPWPGGGNILTKEQARSMWPIVSQFLTLSPAEYPAPARRYSARVTQAQEMTGSFQEVARAGRIVRDIPAMTTRDQVRYFYRGLEGFMPRIAMAFTSGAVDVMTDPKGRGRPKEAALKILELAGQVNGALSPGPQAFFSRQGQHAFEGLVLGQQSLKDWFSETIPVTTDSPEEALGEVLYSSLLRSRALLPYKSFENDASLVSNLAEVLFPGFDARSPAAKQKMAATRAVADQFLETVVGEYSKYRRYETIPEELKRGLRLSGQADTLEGRIAIALDIGGDLDQDPATGELVLKPKGELRSVIGQRIAKLEDATTQKHAILAAQRLLRSEAWSGAVRPLLMEAARMRNLTPDELGMMYKASLKDDRGRALVKMMHSEILGKGRDEIAGPAYRVFAEIHRPAAGDEPALTHWLALRDYFAPFPPPEGQPSLDPILPTGQPFGVGKDIRPGRQSKKGVRLFTKDLAVGDQ